METYAKESTEMKQMDSSVVQVKTPKRILHFSDGILEEFSDDEDNETDAVPVNAKPESLIDPKTLTWGPWISHMAWTVGANALTACDYVGETLADFFGITSPKYFYEIQEYERRQAQNQTLQEHRAGWCEVPADEANLVTKDLQAHRSNIVAPSEQVV